MKRVLNILAGVFLVIGIVFACLPFGTDPLGFLPAGAAFVFAALSFVLVKNDNRAAKILAAAGVAVLVVVAVRNAATKDEVAPPTQQEQEKAEQDDIATNKELEEIPEQEETEGLE